MSNFDSIGIMPAWMGLIKVFKDKNADITGFD